MLGLYLLLIGIILFQRNQAVLFCVAFKEYVQSFIFLLPCFPPLFLLLLHSSLRERKYLLIYPAYHTSAYKYNNDRKARTNYVSFWKLTKKRDNYCHQDYRRDYKKWRTHFPLRRMLYLSKQIRSLRFEHFASELRDFNWLAIPVFTLI